jgi:ribokinase
MIVSLGSDAFALPLEESLNGAGVHLHIKRATDQPTGTAFICVSDDAENAITVAPGANNALRPDDFLPSAELAGFTHLLLQLETPMDTVTAFARTAHQHGVKVVLNAAPAQSLSTELLALIDVLIVNEGELAVVANYTGTVEQCLERLQVPCVVVTLGSRGAWARVNGQILKQAAFAVTPVDTTAAGDTFCGAFVAALSRGQNTADALRQASAAGALACTRPGAQSSIPTHAEVRVFLNNSLTP